LRVGSKPVRGSRMDDGKDDDDMDAVLNKNSEDSGRRKGKSAANKSLITRNLRLAYGEVTSEGVPSRFLDILNRIPDGEGKES
jgi:Anti-sigma factor NepR